jgi:hypothetical protein
MPVLTGINDHRDRTGTWNLALFSYDRHADRQDKLLMRASSTEVFYAPHGNKIVRKGTKDLAQKHVAAG